MKQPEWWKVGGCFFLAHPTFDNLKLPIEIIWSLWRLRWPWSPKLAANKSRRQQLPRNTQRWHAMRVRREVFSLTSWCTLNCIVHICFIMFLRWMYFCCFWIISGFVDSLWHWSGLITPLLEGSPVRNADSSGTKVNETAVYGKRCSFSCNSLCFGMFGGVDWVAFGTYFWPSCFLI